ncbi:hypothetical protein, partial [Acinetobacter baumannii]|uniref:hypothetical protein n=1 Tax=Acinetobacter baumannii TaxID=470 RepID=UPI00197AE663
SISSPQDCDTLQSDLSNLANWEKVWAMEFNAEKCELLRVTRAQNPIIYDYKLHDHTLESVQFSKYLGVYISSNLSWNKHTNETAKKANIVLGMLK